MSELTWHSGLGLTVYSLKKIYTVTSAIIWWQEKRKKITFIFNSSISKFSTKVKVFSSQINNFSFILVNAPSCARHDMRKTKKS